MKLYRRWKDVVRLLQFIIGLTNLSLTKPSYKKKFHVNVVLLVWTNPQFSANWFKFTWIPWLKAFLVQHLKWLTRSHSLSKVYGKKFRFQVFSIPPSYASKLCLILYFLRLRMFNQSLIFEVRCWIFKVLRQKFWSVSFSISNSSMKLTVFIKCRSVIPGEQ